MQLQRATLHRVQHGFNLIEAAIVLGVIGLVIGGIWVAASAASEQRRTTIIFNNVMATCENVRRDWPASSIPLGSFYVREAVAAKILGPDFINPNYSGSSSILALPSLGITVTDFTPVDASAWPFTPQPRSGQINVGLTNIKPPACNRLMRALGVETQRPNSAIWRVSVWNPYPSAVSFTAGSAPSQTDWDNIAGACANQTPPNEIIMIMCNN